MTDHAHSDIILKVYDEIPVEFLLEAIDGALVAVGASDFTSISRDWGHHED